MRSLIKFIVPFLLSLLIAFLILILIEKTSNKKGLLYFFRGNPAPTTTHSKKIKSQHSPKKKNNITSSMSFLERMNEEYTHITQSTLPSVVSVNTQGTKNQYSKDFYGRLYKKEIHSNTQGSGVIVSKEGHLITSYHVIANQKQIFIKTCDEKVYKAHLVGADPTLDIALLKINSNLSFPYLKFADSSAVQEGNIVLAFGNPFGIGKSVTQGIISAKERIVTDNQFGLFQTSVAINPGYSGGPLVNIYGDIIGINSSIYSNDPKKPGFQGISFAVPSNFIKKTYLNILKFGHPARSFLGVSNTPMNNVIKSFLKYNKDFGVLISSISDGSPAQKAGIKRTDVLMTYDNKKIKDFNHLVQLVQQTDINRKILISLWRKGTIVKKTVQIEQYKTPHIYQKYDFKTQKTIHSVGIYVNSLDFSTRFSGIHGVRVTRVMKTSSLSKKLSIGDIIYKIDDTYLHQPNQFYQYLITNCNKKSLNLYIIRNSKKLQNPFILPKI